MNHEIALKWLYTQLKKKRIALGRAEEKRNSHEVDDINRTIDIIEWIIGAVLEKENEDVSFCKECKHRNYSDECCIQLMKDALDLINRQKAEIERLQKRNEYRINYMGYYPKLERDNAIKEFAENVKKNHLAIFNTIYSHPHFCEMIDNLVKEMTEGEDD